MKRIILSFFFLFYISFNCFAQQVEQAIVDSYNGGDFQQAVTLLEKEKDIQKALGLESAHLYYNLGNAYFRTNDIAKARLYYEKALLLNPGDRDIRHNIDFVSSKVEDKILIADTFFLNIWFRSVQNLFSSNGWAMFAVVSFILLIGCLVLFFFSRSVLFKKTAFYVGIVLVVFVIFANVFAYGQKGRIEYRDSAIIMVGSAPILSSPDTNGKEVFILHAGTKVRISKEDKNWIEIEIDNGSIGWIQRDKLEII